METFEDDVKIVTVHEYVTRMLNHGVKEVERWKKIAYEMEKERNDYIEESIDLDKKIDKLQADLDKASSKLDRAVECIERCRNEALDCGSELEDWQIMDIANEFLNQLNKDTKE